MRKTKVPKGQQVAKFGRSIEEQRAIFDEFQKLKGFATGGYVSGKGNIVIDNGGYYTDPNTNVTNLITRTNTQVQVLSNLSRKTMFTLACITLGLDTPELRRKFQAYFNQIDSTWPDDFLYDWLIQKAYEVKYGEPDIT